MEITRYFRSRMLAVTTAVVITAGALVSPAIARNGVGGGPFQFDPLPTSTTCTQSGGDPVNPFTLPDGFAQAIVAHEPQFPDVPDMNTLNETGPQAGRFLYRPHEVTTNGSVTVTDLRTGVTSLLANHSHWERLDGIAWSPWNTILTAEEVNSPAALPDPRVPQAQAGLLYEIDQQTGVDTPRPAVGSRAHEGIRFDPQGNLYGISERSPGYIYKFVPDRRGDLSSGQLYALKVVSSNGDAIWLPLDRTAVQVNSDTAAAAAGATGYNRPEDVEIATSNGNNQGGANIMYVAITGDHRVLRIDLREPGGQGNASVSTYVQAGVNAPVDFSMPDNLALDKNGNLYITEDPGGNFPAKTRGDDIWVALPPHGNGDQASATVRFASLTDCDAEPTGIYFDKSGTTLYVNAQHRGGDGRDEAVAISEER